MSDDADKVLYYPVWIAPGRKAGGWSWGRPCDTAAEAAAAMKAHVADGAPLGCVVRFAGGEKTPLLSYLVPPSARKVAGQWDELCEATAPLGEPASQHRRRH